MNLLISGVTGFFMSGLVRRILTDPILEHIRIRGVTRNSSQKHLQRLDGVDTNRLELIYCDLTGDVNGLCNGMDAVIHGAALTFVNRSILSPESFLQNNAVATLKLLIDADKYKVKKWVQISTDEVLGSISVGSHEENAPYNPSNPYASSKAAAEASCISHANTYGLNTVIARFENLYGPYQGIEKMIPTCCRSLLEGKPCPVYSPGNHVRQWLALSDGVKGVLHLLNINTQPGEIFHIAGARELTNNDLARMIIPHFFKDEPDHHIKMIDASGVRRGHDFRYSLSTKKINATGWQAQIHLDVGIAKTVEWYRCHPEWLI